MKNRVCAGKRRRAAGREASQRLRTQHAPPRGRVAPRGRPSARGRDRCARRARGARPARRVRLRTRQQPQPAVAPAMRRRRSRLHASRWRPRGAHHGQPASPGLISLHVGNGLCAARRNAGVSPGRHAPQPASTRRAAAFARRTRLAASRLRNVERRLPGTASSNNASSSSPDRPAAATRPRAESAATRAPSLPPRREPSPATRLGGGGEDGPCVGIAWQRGGAAARRGAADAETAVAAVIDDMQGAAASDRISRARLTRELPRGNGQVASPKRGKKTTAAAPDKGRDFGGQAARGRRADVARCFFTFRRSNVTRAGPRRSIHAAKRCVVQ